VPFIERKKERKRRRERERERERERGCGIGEENVGIKFIQTVPISQKNCVLKAGIHA